MKQKLLNNFRLRATLFVALLCTAFTGAWGQETITFADLNLVNGTQYSDPFDGGEFTVTFAGGGNDGKYYNTGSGIRVYGNGTMTIASENTIESITITYDGSYKPTDGTVVNVGTYDADNGEWTGSATEIVFTRPSGSGHWRVQSVSVTYATGGSQTETCAAPSFDPATGTTFGNGGLSVSISTDTDGATIYYTLDGSAPTTNSAQYSGAIQLTTTTTIKAIAVKDGMNNSSTATATYTYIDPNANDGSAEHPYTIAEARAAIDAGTGVTGVYATGIVSAIVTAYNSTYGNISYNISADGSTNSDQLQAYRGKSYNGDNFTSEDDIQVGDVVVVYGNLKKYNSTYEFDADNQLVSLDRPVASVEAPTFSPIAGTYADAQNVTISCETAGATIYYTTDGTDPTNQSTEYTGSIAVEGNTTIKAIAYDVTGANSTVATATYHICSADNPYTVTQALAFSEYPANGVYVSGIVSTAPTQSPTNNGQLTYYISVNGEATNQLQVYKGLGLNEAAFTAQDDIQVGDEVTIYGNVKIYNNTKEFDTGNYLVAFNRPATPTITVTSTSLTGFTYLVDNGPSAAQQITVGGENLTNSWSAYLDDYGNSNFEFSFTEDGDYFSETGLGSMPEPNQNVLIYVRLKSGLPVGDYTGAITISSKGAETVTVNLSGSVAAALEAPVWSELPTETISVGEDYVLNLADYVSGSPVPAISIETGGDIAQIQDNVFSFTPTEAGSFDFTFNATNSVGSVNAILTVTVSAPASIEPSVTAINIPAATTTGYETIEVTYKNFTNQPTAHERFYDDDDNILTSNPATWIIVGTSDNNIFYQVTEENTSSEPRSVHFRIWAYDDNQQGVSSELITITQAGVPVPVVDYAELPFNWDGGASSDLAALNGVTLSGNGSDYAATNAPYLVKFDGTGDYIQVKTDSQPGVVTVGVKMIGGGNTSTITVQESADGESFTDVEELTISGKQNDVLDLATTNAFAEDSRYVRLLFTKGSNVGVGPISISKDEPRIIAPETPFEVPTDGDGATFDVTTVGITGDLHVMYCDANGNELIDPTTAYPYDWLTVGVQFGNTIQYSVDKNTTSESRTGYVKIYGTDANNNTVYSNLVTFTQAGFVPSITIEPEVVNIDAVVGDELISSTITTVGITGDYQDLHVQYYDVNGNEINGPEWCPTTIHHEMLVYDVQNNTSSEALTAYMKVYGTDANNNTVYSNLVTVNQAGFVPSITIEPEVVNIDAVVGDELISSTITTVGITGDYQDLHVQYYDVNGNEINGPEWCPTTIHHEMLVYNVQDNTSSEALTAYMKVYGTDANNNTVYSNLVTVNQAANVPTTTYSLATSITAGKHYLIVGSNSKTQEYYAMGSQTNNNRAATAVSVNNGQISITDENVAEVVVYGPDASGNYTIYNAGTGYLYAASSSSNHLKSQSDNDLNGKWAITFNALGYASVEAQGDNSRNVMQFNSSSSLFSCYSSDSQSPVYFFEKNNDDSEAYTANVTLNAFGYATFASNYALDFLDNEDANYSAWQIAEVNDNTNTITFEQITGMVAPATGILLKGKASNVVALNVLPAGGATLGYNKLVGITESTQVGDNQFFGLKGNEFVKVNTGVVPAGKALLPIDNPTAGVKSFTLIFNDADGIQTIETVSAEKAQAIFNLAGQRLPKAQKGINIINGKKVLVK